MLYFGLNRRYLAPSVLVLWVALLAGCASAPPVKTVAVAVKSPASQSRGPAPFVHPLPGARISASFARYIVKSRNRQHHGVDFAAPSGTPVYAASSGVVLSADNTSLSEAFGKAVLIEHGDQLTSLSAHLSRLDVEIGQWVEAGQQIGLVGQTGRATGPHLHFELWRGSVPQDPIAVLPLSNNERKQALAEMQRQAAMSKARPKQTVAKTSKTAKHGRASAKASRSVAKTTTKPVRVAKTSAPKKSATTTKTAKTTQATKSSKNSKTSTATAGSAE